MLLFFFFTIFLQDTEHYCVWNKWNEELHIVLFYEANSTPAVFMYNSEHFMVCNIYHQSYIIPYRRTVASGQHWLTEVVSTCHWQWQSILLCTGLAEHCEEVVPAAAALVLRIQDFIITARWSIFYHNILTVTGHVARPHPGEWTEDTLSGWPLSGMREGWELLLEAMPYVTVLNKPHVPVILGLSKTGSHGILLW